MQNNTINTKCPCCSAPLRYDGGQQKLVCDSCGNTFERDAIAQADDALKSAEQADQMSWQTRSGGEWADAEKQALGAFTCPSCGAEIVADATTGATVCAYCGNPAILPSQLSGNFRPDGVIPFVKTKEDAEKAYKALLKGKRLLPDDYLKTQKVTDVQGVYVPYWLFTCDADADIVYNAERVHMHTTKREEIIDTDHYLVFRGGKIGFDDIPVDGSTKFEDNITEAIEPFDTKKESDFSAEYLPGYQAERYDVNAEAAMPRADERVRTSVQEAFASTVIGFTGVTPRSSSVRLSHGGVRNVLMPVWLLNAKWNGKNYAFAMNGQSGRFVGNLPISKAKCWKWRAGLFLSSFAVLFLIQFALILAGVM